MNQRKAIHSCTLSMLLLGACSSGPPYEARTIDDDVEQVSYVVVNDAELYDIVRVGQPLVERVPGTNQLRIVVPIRNIDDEAIQIVAQVSFLNGSKQPIGDDTNRQVKLLAAGETITHEAISQRAEAADWLLRLDWHR
jgi:hypothetical protein